MWRFFKQPFKARCTESFPQMSSRLRVSSSDQGTFVSVTTGREPSWESKMKQGELVKGQSLDWSTVASTDQYRNCTNLYNLPISRLEEIHLNSHHPLANPCKGGKTQKVKIDTHFFSLIQSKCFLTVPSVMWIKKRMEPRMMNMKQKGCLPTEPIGNPSVMSLCLTNEQNISGNLTRKLSPQPAVLRECPRLRSASSSWEPALLSSFGCCHWLLNPRSH